MGCPWILACVHTNIVYFDIARDDLNAEELAKRLGSGGIRMLATGPNRIRAVTHYGIAAEDIDHTLARLAELMRPD